MSLIQQLSGVNGKYLILVLLLAVWFPKQLHANSELPIYLEAQTIYFDQVTGLSTYQNRVKVKRGNLTITADKALVKQKNNRINTIQGSGAPITLRKRVSAPERTITIKGQRLFYDANTNTVTISGKVTTTRGRDVIRCAKLIYRINENHITAERQPGSAPVSADLWPKKKKNASVNPGTQSNQ